MIDITSERSIENGSAKARLGANKVISKISNLFIFIGLFIIIINSTESLLHFRSANSTRWSIDKREAAMGNLEPLVVELAARINSAESLHKLSKHRNDLRPVDLPFHH